MDRRPQSWEDRLIIYITHLIKIGRASQTISSYISAIKAVLRAEDIFILDNSYELAALVKACKLKNDEIHIRLPIQRNLLHLLVDKIKNRLLEKSQEYLSLLYTAIILTGYHALFRVGELTSRDHPILLEGILLADNKRKFQIVLRTSKTHTKADYPQMVKISVNDKTIPSYSKQAAYCPYTASKKYFIQRRQIRGWKQPGQPLFVFRDGSPVRPENFRYILKKIISDVGQDQSLYDCHRVRKATNLLKEGWKIEGIMQVGRWKSNSANL